MAGFEDKPQRIISDFSKLDFDYVPEKLVHRDGPMQQLFSILKSSIEDSTNQRVAVTGSVGTGKSSLSKRFCLDFREWASGKGQRVEFVIVNCRSRNTPSSVLLKILEKFQPGFPDRGFSTTEMLEILRKHLTKGNVHLLIVLDEVNVMVKKSGSDLLYCLSRFDDERVTDSKHSLSLIMISQQPVNEFLDAATLSTLKRTNQIVLDKYSRPELGDITRQRAELAFHPGTVDDEIIEFIADISSEFGDARFAIELLENAGRMANDEGQESVNPENVRAAKAMTYSVVTESKLASLGLQKQLVLLGISRMMRKRAFATTGEAEKSYAVACEEFDQKARGHTQFWEYLRTLGDMGLIGLGTSGKGMVGKTSIITLPDIPCRVLEDKLLQVMVKE
ncbi:MAG: AAA family ATPase [Candidatus Thermoplasmatota archaeon]|nr:AAA family ATPase [Euryarchaeota archaeon]MBU4031319.1 AAA family ATPase [Candidatus Thermoplasmatota archaeon]MBU4071724.1 AAA family ATPase [Candidatus Thermoplasmatota archaeon]MBU4143911.1 AAA family ATPase [Candidatus Thermoplasmatota archaeon]MBU4591663.1 AAA family ATPase [Candidatus Thermoplasmatota archaeon]